MNAPAALLQSLRSRGVALWSKDNQLFYKAPTGALQPGEIELLRAHKREIIALVQTDSERNQIPVARKSAGPAPLTFSQMLHWRWLQSGERQPMRHMASATRLRGKLSIEAVRQSIAEVVKRHEALRTKIFLRHGAPVQEVDEQHKVDVRIDDLQDLSPDEQESETLRAIEETILERCDIAIDSMFVARLLRLGAQDHVLVLAMEHIISDAYSRSLLLRDVLGAYAEACSGHSQQLPQIGVQFPDYAAWQRSHLQPQLEKNLSFWMTRLQGCRRLRFPADRRSSVQAQAGWGSAPFTITDELNVQLRDWSKRRGTTPAMAALTAFMGLVFLWYRVSDAVVLYQSDGRFYPQVENTVGFFASTLYLRAELCEGDSWLELLRRVTQEYCVAYDHADHSLMETLEPGPEFLANPGFNWVLHGGAAQGQKVVPDVGGLHAEPFSFDNPVLRGLTIDSEPQILLRDTRVGIVAAVHFPANKYSREAMEYLGRMFAACLRELLTNGEGPVKNAALGNRRSA
jgi:Condensation domain/TubC N-terminal docking domain